MTNFRTMLVAVLAVSLSLTSCMKDVDVYDLQGRLELEKQMIEEYVEENMPNALFSEETGIWYELIAEGEPNSYEYKTIGVGGNLEAPIISVKYRVELLNGVLIEENVKGMQSSLANMIPAWQIMFLPKVVNGMNTTGLTEHGMQKGSHVRFVTPSPWAYRDAENGNIPPNSPLYFEIEVLDINPPSGNFQ